MSGAGPFDELPNPIESADRRGGGGAVSLALDGSVGTGRVCSSPKLSARDGRAGARGSGLEGNDGVLVAGRCGIEGEDLVGIRVRVVAVLVLYFL